MSVTIKLRRGLASEWASNSSIVLASGEPGFEIDTGRLKIGNGVSSWSSLNYSSIIPTGLLAGSGIDISLGANGSTATISVIQHTHDSSSIPDFDSRVSGLLPTISNSGDNRILTSTGSTNGINAESAVTFDGTNFNVNGVMNVDNLRLDGNTISATNNNGNIIIQSTGTGSLQRDSGGNARGQYAVDWQNSRVSGTMVAAGNYSVIGGGKNNSADVGGVVAGGANNTAAGIYNVVGGGRSNTVSDYRSTIAGGAYNIASAGCSILGGTTNTASGYSSTIGGGRNNSTQGQFSAILGGDNNIASGNYSAILGGTLNRDNNFNNVFILGSNITATQADTTYTQNLISQSGRFTSLNINGTGVSLSGHTHISSDITNFNSSVSGLVDGIYAPLNSPTLTGAPLAPTASSGTNTNQIASTAFVRTEISNLVGSAPGTLDTLNELAAALGNDANFSTTITNSLTGKANLSGATFTGNISAPTGNFTDITVGNLNLKNNTLRATNTNGSIIIQTNGTGALQRDVAGNARGMYAVDLQSSRRFNTQVASSKYSVIGGGRDNTASDYYTTIAGGYVNSASNRYAFVGGGGSNLASGYGSAICGGKANVSSSSYTIVAGGRANTSAGYYSSILGGNNNIASGNYSAILGGQQNSDNNFNNVFILGSNITANKDDTTFVNNLDVASSGDIDTLKINKLYHQNLAVATGFADSDLMVVIIDPTGSPSTEVIKGDILRSSLLQQPAKLQFRQGTDAERLLITPASGEPIWTTDTQKFYIGDGSTVGGDFIGPSPHNRGGGVQSIVALNQGCTANGDYSTVAGGTDNNASSYYGSVLGGSNNNVSSNAEFSTICGGRDNTISGYNCVIGGGEANATSGGADTVGGGRMNTASGGYSTVGGGYFNTSSGYNSIVGGGRNNTASGNYSVVCGGFRSKASRYGENSHAAGYFANIGDAQHTILIARRLTTNNTANQVLFLDGSSARLTLPAKTTWIFEVKLSAYNDTDGAAAGWIFRGVIRRNSTNGTALVGSLIEENWKDTIMNSTIASVVADDTNEALEIRVTGLTSKNIRWVAVIDISQVSYGTP